MSEAQEKVSFVNQVKYPPPNDYVILDGGAFRPTRVLHKSLVDATLVLTV